jgi:hypothetical protein
MGTCESDPQAFEGKFRIDVSAQRHPVRDFQGYSLQLNLADGVGKRVAPGENSGKDGCGPAASSAAIHETFRLAALGT